MRKTTSDSEKMLYHLDALSSYLTRAEETDNIFQKPLKTMRNILGFDVSILYGISNIIDTHAIIEVIRIHDPLKLRPDLWEGRKIMISLDAPDKTFTNEAGAIISKNTVTANIPGNGCDIVGYVYMPESTDSYLFGGDYVGDHSELSQYEVNSCTIMCNILSSIMMKTKYKEWARHDGLTGLLNSRTIRSELIKSIEKTHRKVPATLSVILCDIDHFKNVNDTHGHIQGDSVIREIGSLLAESMRKHFDIAGRYGGEEFLLILEDTNHVTTLEISERIRHKIMEYPFSKIDKSGNKTNGHIAITMSFGVASLTSEELSPQSPEKILADADIALYKAKESGRNCVKGMTC